MAKKHIVNSHLLPLIVVSTYALTLFSACTIQTQRYDVFTTRQAGALPNNTSTLTNTKKSIEHTLSIQQSLSTSIDHLILKQEPAPLNQSSYALIIGIENYQQHTGVNYAKNSADSFSLAASRLLGIPKENIFQLTNKDATSGQIKTKLHLLKELAEPGDDIYIYFAGHGVPSSNGNTYLLPYDMSADAIALEPSLELFNVYKLLNDSAADRIYVFIDSCFSGKADDGQLLFKGVAPVFKKKKRTFSSNKLTVITAGGQNDFANQYPEEQQRLFGYYLLRGLIDKKENIKDLYDYIRRNVKQKSLRIGLGYKQIPQLQVGK